MFIGFAFYDRAKNSCVNFFGKISIHCSLEWQVQATSSFKNGPKNRNFAKKVCNFSNRPYSYYLFNDIPPHEPLMQARSIPTKTRELKQRRRRGRRGRPLVENEFDWHFISEIRDCLYLFGTPIALIVLQINLQWHRPIPNGNSKL